MLYCVHQLASNIGANTVLCKIIYRHTVLADLISSDKARQAHRHLVVKQFGIVARSQL